MAVPKDHPQPGPGAPLTAERDRYRRLMALGMSNYRACLEIGAAPDHGHAVEQGPLHGRSHRQGALQPDQRGDVGLLPPLAGLRAAAQGAEPGAGASSRTRS